MIEIVYTYIDHVCTNAVIVVPNFDVLQISSAFIIKEIIFGLQF